jgi:hypothetical protein
MRPLKDDDRIEDRRLPLRTMCASVMDQSSARQKQVKVPPQDGRSADARLMRRTREALALHCGVKPSATQRALIDPAAWLTLCGARLDEKAITSSGVQSPHAAKQYPAYSNSLTRTLRQLGLKGAADKAVGLARLPGRPLRPSTRGMTGRPSTYSQEVADEVCGRRGDGHRLRSPISGRDGMIPCTNNRVSGVARLRSTV